MTRFEAGNPELRPISYALPRDEIVEGFSNLDLHGKLEDGPVNRKIRRND